MKPLKYVSFFYSQDLEKHKKYIERVKSEHPDKKCSVEIKEETIFDVLERKSAQGVRITVTFEGYKPHTAYGAPL